MPYNRRYGRGRGRRRRFRMKSRFRGSRRSFRGRRNPAGHTGSAMVTRQSGGNLNRISSLRLYQPSLNPDVIYLKLKYSDILQEAPGVIEGTHNYTGNGMIDPNQTDPGSVNPVGFAEWMLFYGRYRVLASKFRLRVYNTAQTIGILWTVHPTFSNNIVSNWEDKSVQPYSQTGIMGVEPGGANMVDATLYMSTKKLRGDAIVSLSFAGTSTTNPSALWVWKVELLSQNETSPIVYTINAEIIYYTKLFDRFTISQEPTAVLAIALERAIKHGIIAKASELNTLERPPPKDQMAIPPTPSPPPVILKEKVKMPKLDLGSPALGPNGTLLLSEDDLDIVMKDSITT